MKTGRDIDVVLQDRSGAWLRFARPLELVVARRTADVLPALRYLEAAVHERGQWAVGFLAYEAAAAFDPALTTRPPGRLPLLWFGLFVAPEPAPAPGPAPAGSYTLGEWAPSVTWEPYEKAIEQIKERIAAGETYQVNYTMRLRTAFAGRAADLFGDLVAAQQPGHAAFLETREWAICSASPELFFTLDGEQITTRPMKGTAGRGLTPAADRARRDELAASAKDQAENVMILDMIRNDLGRIARTGSVEVGELFALERYPTVWQMISTIHASTSASLVDILRALFPCASITGAPKVRTMAVIADLETEPRGVYTGAIGYLGPGRQAHFNVAIRTVVVDKRSGQAEYGVGGGIVWDSSAAGEFAECQAKARILAERRPTFDLLESLRWTPENGYALLEEHLARLAESAAYFGYAFRRAAVCRTLDELAAGLPRRIHKVRLLLRADGKPFASAEPLVESAEPVRLAMAARPVDSGDVFLYHKTTHRVIYEEALAARPAAGDVILWNERGELTETATANLVILQGGEWLTPPLAAGLLAGTYRGRLLAEGKIREATLRREDLDGSEEIAVVNSVRGWREARLVE